MKYEKEILSFNEAIDYLDVSKSFLYKMVSTRKISFTKPNGGKLYFKKADLDKWMMKNPSLGEDVLEEKMFNHLNRKSHE